MKQLPVAFVERTRTMMGEALWRGYAEAMGQEPPVSIRLNRRKVAGLAELAGLSEWPDMAGAAPVPWCAEGFYLPRRPQFTLDPLLHAGAYYVQEASSMAIVHVLRQLVGPGRKVEMLDMCAAPGGKSTAALSAVEWGSTLLANEPIRQRAGILAENLTKWGNPYAECSCQWPKDIARGGRTFDIVICDVPCSGEGMFQTDDGAIAQWSPRLVDDCARLQREILGQAWQCLRQGGLMIYSTCTFNTRENEENIQWICSELGAEPVAVDCPAEWNIAGSLLEGCHLPVLRFIPGQVRGRGLFMAALRKTSPTSQSGKRQAAKPRPRPKPDERLALQATAMLETPERDKYPRVGLSREQALAYLRREALALSESTPRGHVVVEYKGLPLGFVKNIGTRANNLYPKEWRILKQ